MKYTLDQENALSAINLWLSAPYDDDNWFFALAGYAGTGKTTLLQKIISDQQLAPICCAPTWKAASVLKSKLPPQVEVKTVHSILYNPCDRQMHHLDKLIAERVSIISDRSDDVKAIKKIDTAIAQEKDRLANLRVNFKVKPNLEKLRGKLIIVDEASMVSERMALDFKLLGCKVLFVGDSFQLPPVNSIAWFAKVDKHASLEHVVRQALDSKIIQLSVQIREGLIDQKMFQKGECILRGKDKLSYSDWLAADQVITGSNKSRQRINRFFRKQLARDNSHFPVNGDKLICLKNDQYKYPAWVNGTQFVANGDCEIQPEGHLGLFGLYEGVNLLGIEFHTHPCEVHYNPEAIEVERDMRDGLFECDYAYCITGHKSQGSEYDFVIIADDKMNNENKDFRAKWLYTAVTRAKQKLILCQ